MKKETFFAFDLDGTVTKEEILPILAKELNLEEEMRLLTKLTLDGTIKFEQSFKLRTAILRGVSISKIREIISNIELDRDIKDFIKQNEDICGIVTGNLDLWIKPIVEKLGCRVYSSIGKSEEDKLVELEQIMVKSKAIFDIRKDYEKVVCIGESINDIPMFTESDISIAYGAVHEPVKEIKQISDYIIYRGDALCHLLNTLL